MYAGDVRRQTERMWENVEALLKEADCGFGDVGHIIVYLRDIADYAVVKEMFDKRFPRYAESDYAGSRLSPGVAGGNGVYGGEENL